MKKKLLSLLLVLVLAQAMLVPTLAVTFPVSREHYHTYLPTSAEVIVGYEYVNLTYHRAVYGYIHICSGCGAETAIPNGRKGNMQPHNNGYYCTVCDHVVQMRMLEKMAADIEEQE